MANCHEPEACVVTALVLYALIIIPMEAPVPAVIPSYTHVTDHDPNAQRNRIPTEAELAGLKAFKETHSSLVTHLQGEVSRAQAAHEQILGRYHQQLRELEGTQSQFHGSKRMLQVLQDQVLVHQAEVARLSGITHPIRRYPSDVLQYLFEYAHDITEEDLKLNAAFALSHVCQRWRAIALDTPRLCCHIDFTLDEEEEEEEVRLFWDSMVSRMKAAPAFITISGHNEATSSKFSECNLAVIPNIMQLHLHLDSPEGVSDILSLPNPFPETGMGSLSIQCNPEAGPELTSRVSWDVGEIIDKLPLTPYLSLWAPCSLRVTPSVNFGSLTKLRLECLINVDVMAILSSCAQLSELFLLQVAFSDVTSDRITSHSLRRLIISANNNEGLWIKQILCPNLLAFYHETGSSESTLSFVESHRSILTLGHSSGEELVPKLAIMAPQLQSLETDRSQLHALCTPEATGAECLPFPHLQELTVALDRFNMTLDDFEVIVGTRCLPIGHPQSRLPPSLAPLRRLCLQRDPEEDSNQPWMESALYKEAKRVGISNEIWDYYEIEELSWT